MGKPEKPSKKEKSRTSKTEKRHKDEKAKIESVKATTEFKKDKKAKKKLEKEERKREKAERKKAKEAKKSKDKDSKKRSRDKPSAEADQPASGSAAVPSGWNNWAAAEFDDDKRKQKFLRFMGIKSDATTSSSSKQNASPFASAITKEGSTQIHNDLEKQFSAGIDQRGQGRRGGLGF
ncbi:hypothetical protein H4R23_002430 [Coemansia sp. Cherry 401B]|nr:hypothetical protein H4R23_002430 [Coemansia sp. Cherry 401B]